MNEEWKVLKNFYSTQKRLQGYPIYILTIIFLVSLVIFPFLGMSLWVPVAIMGGFFLGALFGMKLILDVIVHEEFGGARNKYDEFCRKVDSMDFSREDG